MKLSLENNTSQSNKKHVQNEGSFKALMNLADIVSTLEEVDQKKEILTLIRKDPNTAELLKDQTDEDCVDTLKRLFDVNIEGWFQNWMEKRQDKNRRKKLGKDVQALIDSIYLEHFMFMSKLNQIQSGPIFTEAEKKVVKRKLYKDKNLPKPDMFQEEDLVRNAEYNNKPNDVIQPLQSFYTQYSDVVEPLYTNLIKTIEKNWKQLSTQLVKIADKIDDVLPKVVEMDPDAPKDITKEHAKTLRKLASLKSKDAAEVLSLHSLITSGKMDKTTAEYISYSILFEPEDTRFISVFDLFKLLTRIDAAY